MSETMYLRNQFSDEFLEDEPALNAYWEMDIVPKFEETAQVIGMHLVPGSIQEREGRWWIPADGTGCPARSS